jgi:hypothetical protein
MPNNRGDENFSVPEGQCVLSRVGRSGWFLDSGWSLRAPHWGAEEESFRFYPIVNAVA